MSGAAGTPLRTLQEFARNSTPMLTMNVYAQTLRGSLADATARLPDLGCSAREAVRATGTCDVEPIERKKGSRSIPPQIAPRIAPNAAHERATSSKNLPASDEVARGGTVSHNHIEKRKNERTQVHEDAREWMGIEPTRRRVSDASTALKAAGPTRRPDTPSDATATLSRSAP